MKLYNRDLLFLGVLWIAENQTDIFLSLYVFLQSYYLTIDELRAILGFFTKYLFTLTFIRCFQAKTVKTTWSASIFQILHEFFREMKETSSKMPLEINWRPEVGKKVEE